MSSFGNEDVRGFNVTMDNRCPCERRPAHHRLRWPITEEFRFLADARQYRASASPLPDTPQHHTRGTPHVVGRESRRTSVRCSPAARFVRQFGDHPRRKEDSPKGVLENPSLIPREKDSIVYCTCPSDKTSRAILHRVRAMRFIRIKFLKGGLAAWKAKGYPVEPYNVSFHF
jgi:rhodanese-related sulfurtransferase